MADDIVKVIADTRTDAASLQVVVNGDEDTQVITRLGESYPTVKKAIKLMTQTGVGFTPFESKNLMTNSSLANGTYAVVTNDTTDNNGLYFKKSAGWVKVTWDIDARQKEYTDAAKYSAVSAAAADATTKANDAKTQAVALATDLAAVDATTKSNNAKTQAVAIAVDEAAIDATSKADAAKDEAVTFAAEVEENSYSMTDRAVKDEKISSAISKLPDDSEWAFALQSDQGVLGLKKNGDVILPKPEITVGSAAISSFYDDAAFKLADKDGKIVFAVDKDGQPITSNSSAAKGKVLTRIKKTEANKMSVYQKGSSTNYIEYNFERETFAFDGSSPSNNLDCWRIKAAFECSADYLKLRTLVDIGAWECAIKEDGAADFIGTFHGDDVLTDAFFIINNKEYGQSSLFDITNPASFEFVQTSNLYSCNTQTKLASCYRHYQWFNNSVTVEQKITFVTPVVVKEAYLAMLPVKRKLDDNTQITDSGLRLYDGNVYHDPDMTTTSFSLNMTPASDGALSKLWGKTSGVGFEVKMKNTPNLPNQDFYISNAALYNKFYFNAKGTGSAAGTYTTQTNEVWKSVIQFTLTTTN